MIGSTDNLDLGHPGFARRLQPMQSPLANFGDEKELRYRGPAVLQPSSSQHAASSTTFTTSKASRRPGLVLDNSPLDNAFQFDLARNIDFDGVGISPQ